MFEGTTPQLFDGPAVAVPYILRVLPGPPTGRRPPQSLAAGAFDSTASIMDGLRDTGACFYQYYTVRYLAPPMC